jgi:uncharacterized protein
MLKTITMTLTCCGILLTLALPARGFDGLDPARIEQQAQGGDADAQSKLGVMYASGVGRKQDRKEALRWYRRAAEQGNPVGEWNLAFMYVKGEGVATDFHEARKLFRKAAEGGLPNAQYDLGIMLLDGLGGNPDRVEAEKWFRLAAARGYREANKILKELDPK